MAHLSPHSDHEIMKGKNMRKALLVVAIMAAPPLMAQDYPRGSDPRWQSPDDRYQQQQYEQERAQREIDAQRRDLDPSDRDRYDQYERDDRGGRHDRDDRNASREGGRYDARVTSVRAVVAESGQHCWIERERVAEPGNGRSGANVPGAVVGAIVGGVLGVFIWVAFPYKNQPPPPPPPEGGEPHDGAVV